ncbi:formimidoylglutamase [Peijinzhouia sedimentorum]
MSEICLFSEKELKSQLRVRPNELKTGQEILLPSSKNTKFDDKLQQLRKQGCQMVILGIPESIGVKANLGNSGAENGWKAFLDSFLNTQTFKGASSIAILGRCDVDDLQSQAAERNPAHKLELKKLRNLCNKLDARVEKLLSKIIAAELIPIVIGGGHNNAFPIIAAHSKFLNSPIDVLNIDPHADFRLLEGRHSGNPFSYAHDAGYLDKYFVYGLDTAYNSREMLNRLESAKGEWIERKETGNIENSILKALKYFKNSKNVGLELDMDAIAGVSVSALNPLGFAPIEVCQIVHTFTEKLKPIYFHLPESAPKPNENSWIINGKVSSALVRTFIEAYGLG